MGVRNAKKEMAERLESKTLEARFLEIVQKGLGCSAFEGEAVLDVVREVFFPFYNEASPQAPPGKVTLVAVSADEPAGKAIKDCAKTIVCLTLHRGTQDDRLLLDEGAQGFRRSRIADLCQEAMSQGALLTREDLALRIFFVDPRTISRDLRFLRQTHPDLPLPLRGTVCDIGPVLTHRTQIVRLALIGKTTTQICNILHHSPPAVANYLSTFTRCAQLAQRGMQVGQIAYLLRRGPGLIAQYLALLEECKTDRNMQYHLDELLQLTRVCKKKTTAKRGDVHGR
jgi:DNA-binding CsgD family transcriptional regulator